MHHQFIRCEKYGERVEVLVNCEREAAASSTLSMRQARGGGTSHRRAVVLPREEGKQFVGKFTPAMDGP